MSLLKKILIGLAGLVVLLILVYFLFPGAVLWTGNTMARMSADVSCSRVDAAGHDWAYLEGGNEEGESIIFLHGFGMSKDLWTAVLPPFSEKFHLVVPDLPGFGETEDVEGQEYDVAVQADRLDKFINKVGLESFHLVGVSMGGGIAGIYAARHPDRIKSLVLIGPYGVQCPKRSEFQEQYSRGTMVLVSENVDEFDRALSYAMKYPPEIPSHVKKYLSNEAAGEKPFLVRGFDRQIKIAGWNTLQPYLGRIKAPTLVIFGKDERVFDPSCASRYREGIQKCTTEVIPDSGHLAYADQPEKVSKMLISFIEATGR